MTFLRSNHAHAHRASKREGDAAVNREFLRRPNCLFLAAGVVLSVIGAGCGHSQQAAPPPAPTAVEVTDVIQKDVPIYGDWVGTLDGYVNAQIQPQVSGYLIKQDYREGSLVHKDDVLFEIDPRPFQAVLDQTKAQLAQAQAQLGNAALNVKRDIPEAQQRAIPQSQLDNDTQAKLGAEASVKGAEAAVEQAELNLGFTKVRSLIDGIVGIAQVQVGNLVSPTTVLTAVSQVNPIKVYFPISGDEYLAITRRINPGTVNLFSDSQPIPLQLILSDGSTYSHKGRILFADRQVDQQTGTIRLAGEFANPENILRPGQYGRVRAVTDFRKNALLVPQRAVTELQGNYQIAVVTPQNKVEIRDVKVGPRVDSLWVISDGLKPGERVVAEGTSKVREGMTVTPTTFQPGQGG